MPQISSMAALVAGFFVAAAVWVFSIIRTNKSLKVKNAQMDLSIKEQDAKDDAQKMSDEVLSDSVRALISKHDGEPKS